MRHTFLKLSLLALSAMMFASGCNKSDQQNLKENAPISFGTQITKAPVTDKNQMGDFSVWGWCYKADTKHAKLFDATPVHADGTYTDGGTRFWADGFTHDFYAVHPTTGAGNMQVTENGILTVTGFDASERGNKAIDLMTASNTGIEYVQDTDPATKPDPVSLNFRHELARVTFSVNTKENCKVVVTLIGAAYKGDLTKNFSDGTSDSEWTIKGCSFPSGVPYQEGSSMMIPENNPTVLFGGTLLVPPQDLSLVDKAIYPSRTTPVYVFMRHQYDNSAPVDRDIYLNDIKGADGKIIDKWEAGKSYNYVINIPENGKDIEITVQVNDWNDQDMSVVL